MSDDGYNVSKSIFYTPIISNEVPTQKKIKHIKQHFHVIESKILPSGISEILPKNSLNLLKCDSCDYTTSRKCHLNEHYRFVHLKLKVICDLCGKEFSNINQHMRVVHKVLKSGILSKKQCQECHKQFYDLTKHMAKAHNLKYEYDYECHLCRLKCKTKFILQRHMQRKHGSKSFCQECGKKVSNLDLHIKKMHQSCKLCHKRFSKEELKKHLCSVNQSNETDDEIINKLLDNHQNISDIKNSQSSLYSRQSLQSDPNNTKLSANVISSSINFETQNFIIGDASSVLEDVVIDHEDVEILNHSKSNGSKDKSKTNIKPPVNYKCDLCSYSTNKTTNYNMHYKMVHLKNRTLCQLCGKEYSNINQHMRVIHKVLKSGKTEKVKCQDCNQEYYDIDQHRRRAHSNLYVGRDCKCDICGANFSKYANLIRHQKRVHQKIRTTCDICQKQVSNIDKHKKVHVKNSCNEKVSTLNQLEKDHKTKLKNFPEQVSKYTYDKDNIEITESHFVVTEDNELIPDCDYKRQNLTHLSHIIQTK